MDIQNIKDLRDRLYGNISNIIVGKGKTIELIIVALLSKGHVLIEDRPGTGKTMLAKAVALSMSGEFKRIQFTPDLMPSDVTGINIYNQKEAEFKLMRGPVFTNILLADEINRATPRTQSSLLEAMEEKQVTIDGETLKLREPFMVLATENPIETTGTYPLPEAQLDRFFMKLDMGENEKQDELSIIDRYINSTPLNDIKPVCGIDEIIEAQKAVSGVYVHQCVREYIVDIIMETRKCKSLVSGVSSRGTLALTTASQAYAAINGRSYVEPDDVIYVAPYVLSHRVCAYGYGTSYKRGLEIIRNLVSEVTVPIENWEL